MRTTFLFALFGLLACAGMVQAGELQVTQEGTVFRVESPFYRLAINTARGAAVRSFIYKPFDPAKEWVYPVGGGLCEDMIWQQGHPGELQDYPYEYKVLEQTPRIFRLEAWRAFQRDPYPGLIMRKVYTLTENSPAIRVTMTLENPSQKEMFPGVWIQNRMFCGGNKGVQVAFRPSYLGIRMAYVDTGRSMGDDFVRKPAAGWAMTFDRDSGAGMLSLMDFNYLQMHYTCMPAYTNEWFYDRVLIQPGKSWTTQYMLVPVKDVKNCYYGDPDLYVTADQQGEQLTFNARATDAPLPEVAIAVRAEKADRSGTLGETS
ncbi:MAG TPA: hypothetical protein VGM23_07100, partial [Armatimonadota bacterium]